MGSRCYFFSDFIKCRVISGPDDRVVKLCVTTLVPALTTCVRIGRKSGIVLSITIHQRHWVIPELDLRNWIYVAITDTWAYCLVTPELDLCCNNWHMSILPCTSVRPLFLPSLASSRFSLKCKSLQPVTDPPNPPKPPRCGSITWLDCGAAALKKGFLGKE